VLVTGGEHVSAGTSVVAKIKESPLS
jgi:hypothetical protein